MTGISTTRAVERCEQLAIIGPPPQWWHPILLLRWLRLYRAIMALDISVHAETLRTLYTPDWVTEMAHRPNNAFRGLTKLSDSREYPERWVEPVVRFIGDDMEVGKPHPLLPRGAVVKSIDRETGNVTYEVP